MDCLSERDKGEKNGERVSGIMKGEGGTNVLALYATHVPST